MVALGNPATGAARPDREARIEAAFESVFTRDLGIRRVEVFECGQYDLGRERQRSNDRPITVTDDPARHQASTAEQELCEVDREDRSTACRSRSRISSTAQAFARRRYSNDSSIASRRRTRRWSHGFVTRARCCPARRTCTAGQRDDVTRQLFWRGRESVECRTRRWRIVGRISGCHRNLRAGHRGHGSSTATAT
jgi:hypothetical protein